MYNLTNIMRRITLLFLILLISISWSSIVIAQSKPGGVTISNCRSGQASSPECLRTFGNFNDPKYDSSDTRGGGGSGGGGISATEARSIVNEVLEEKEAERRERGLEAVTKMGEQGAENVQFVVDNFTSLDLGAILSGSLNQSLEGIDIENIGLQEDGSISDNSSGITSLLNAPNNNLGPLDGVIGDIADRLEDKGLFSAEEENRQLSKGLFEIYLRNNYQYILNESLISPTTGLPTGVEDRVEISYTPSNPRPGDYVTIKFKNYSSNSKNSYFEWYGNGEIITSGFGLDTLKNFKINNDGLPEDITVYVRKDNGVEITKDITISPSEIDIIFEPNTVSHASYKGKPYFTHESTLKIIALPRILDSLGNTITPQNFNYEWRINNQLYQSGVGNNVIYYESPFISEGIKISLNIESVDEGYTSSKVVGIKPGEPIVLIYEDNPVYGTMYERAIYNDVTLNRSELSIKAVPYGFNPGDSIYFNWIMNNQSLVDPIDDRITFRAEDDAEGTSVIELEVLNNFKRLQRGNSSLNINFN